MIMTIIKKIVFILLLVSFSILILHGVEKLRESRWPFIDIELLEPLNESDAHLTADSNSLRFAVATMVSAETTFATYQTLVREIGVMVGRKEVFILRPSYADVRNDLENANVDLAFVCTGTYVNTRKSGRIKILVQPEFENSMDYRCLIIVPAESSCMTLDDLQGRVMAFTDPESNTGCIIPCVAVSDLGYDVKTFFGKNIFTGSHDRSIQAVAMNFVDAAGILSLVWESLIKDDPSLADQVRVIWRSEAFGPPSIVIPVSLDKKLEESLLHAFLSLDKTQDGRKIISELGIKRFVTGREEDYKTAVELYERFEIFGGPPWH